MNKLSFHLRKLEKESKLYTKQAEGKTWWRSEYKSMKTENRKTKRNNKSWFFENINKNDKPLARLTKTSKEKTWITKIMNERGHVSTNPQTSKVLQMLEKMCSYMYKNEIRTFSNTTYKNKLKMN